MAMTFEQFMEASGAEFVANNIIVGAMADRKIVGTYDGVFQLNEAGQALLEELEAPAEVKATRKKKAEADAEAKAE